MVALSAQASSPARAADLVNGRISGFVRYIEQRQTDAGVGDDRRVVVQVLKHGAAGSATIVVGAKKTMPIVVFLAVMIAVFGLAFMLENMRPRIRQVEVRKLA
jgi:capsular polysaccharide biosynthesis protein